jgi:hypothetical protein
MLALFSHLVALIISSIVLALMIKLRNESCNCLLDWRNMYVLVYSVIVIIVELVAIGLLYVRNYKIMKILDSTTMKGIMYVIIPCALVLNLYCLFSYTQDLENSKCNCITVQNVPLFNFVYYYIRIALIIFAVYLITAVVLLAVANHK